MNIGFGHTFPVSNTARLSHTDGLLAAVSTAAYVASTVKFMSRDPLSTDTGMQAYIEIALVAVSLMVAVVLIIRRSEFPRPTPPALGFAAFAALTMLSSVFSYWPALSLIKACMLIAILSIAILLCTSRPPKDVLGYFYWSSFGIVVLGVCLKVCSQQPLFDADDYSGRLRFSVFAWHWGSLADLVALAFLVGRLLPRRPPWFCQLFLLCINLATCARSSNVSLIVIFVASTLWASKMSVRAIAILAFGAATAALIGWISLTVSLPVRRIPFERFYGEVTLDEITTLNGRTGVWAESQALIPSTVVFGYGLEGARAAILREFEWAGHSHNAYLELLLAGGLPGLLVFLIGWGTAIAKAFQTNTAARPFVLGLYMYQVICGLTDPNLTLLQFLPMFLIVCVDACARTDSRASVRLASMRGSVVPLGTPNVLIRSHA